MATVDMNDIYPDNTDHQAKEPPRPEKPEIETIIINEDDVTIEDKPNTNNKKSFAVQLFNKYPRTKTAVKYLVEQIIKPGALSLASRALHSLVDFIVYEGPRSRDENGAVDYNGISSRNARDPFERDYPRDDDDFYIHEKPYGSTRNESFGLQRIGFRTEESAQNCLNEMKRKLNRDGKVTVEYFFTYVDKRCPQFTAYQWGWVSLDRAKIVPVPKGYKIIFPEVIYLN